MWDLQVELQLGQFSPIHYPAGFAVQTVSQKFILKSINFHGSYSFLGMDSLYTMTKAKDRLVAYRSVFTEAMIEVLRSGRTGRCRPGMKRPSQCKLE